MHPPRTQSAGARGISVIVIRGDGAISPEEFRRNAEARMALEAAASRKGPGGENGPNYL